MNANGRVLPPTTDDIERRFHSPGVIVTRPVILGGIRVLRAARRFGWEPRGLEHLQSVQQPMVIAANHQSHVDTAAILGTLPRAIRSRTAVAAALDVFGSPNNGAPPSLKRECLQLVVAAGFHAFAFDRHGPPLRSIRTAVDLIRSGWNLLLYPEGTRSRNGEIAAFKAGVGLLARFAQCPVVPTYVHGGRQVLPCGVTIPRRGQVIVRYDRPMLIGEESPIDFTTRLEQRIRGMAGERKPAAATH